MAAIGPPGIHAERAGEHFGEEREDGGAPHVQPSSKRGGSITIRVGSSTLRTMAELKGMNSVAPDGVSTSITSPAPKLCSARMRPSGDDDESST